MELPPGPSWAPNAAGRRPPQGRAATIRLRADDDEGRTPSSPDADGGWDRTLEPISQEPHNSRRLHPCGQHLTVRTVCYRTRPQKKIHGLLRLITYNTSTSADAIARTLFAMHPEEAATPSFDRCAAPRTPRRRTRRLTRPTAS